MHLVKVVYKFTYLDVMGHLLVLHVNIDAVLISTTICLTLSHFFLIFLYFLPNSQIIIIFNFIFIIKGFWGFWG